MGQNLSKKKFYNLIFSVDWHVILNAFLVEKGFRPALLVQFDYGMEHLSNLSEPMAKLQSAIRILFPDLIITESPEGFYASLHALPENVEDAEVKGHVLGYPCASDYQEIIENDISSFVFNLKAKLTDEAFHEVQSMGYNVDQVMHLLNVRCKSIVHRANLEMLQRKAISIIRDHALASYFVSDIVLEEEFIPSEREILNAILEGKPLTAQDKIRIQNFLDVYNISLDDVQFDNPFHRGIIYTIIMHERSIVGGFLLYFPQDVQDEYLQKQDKLYISLQAALEKSKK